MKSNWLRILLLVQLLFASTGQSADVSAITTLFSNTFQSGYQSGQCKKNIHSLIEQAKISGTDLSGALYLTIDGYGDLSYYHGRSSLGSPPSTGIWYYHYALLVPTDGSTSSEFSADRNYVVLDYDFGSEPRAIALRTYLREMFMSPGVRSDERKVAKDFELGLIKLTAHDVENPLEIRFDAIRFHDLYQSLP